MDLTGELKKLQGKRLTTLYQNKPFEIKQISTDQVILKTSKEATAPHTHERNIACLEPFRKTQRINKISS